MRRAFILSVRALLAVITIATGCAGQASAQRRRAVPVCPPLAAHIHSGPLPHRAYTLYTGARNRWQPIATDGSRVLMGWETSREPRVGGPVHLSVVHLPSTRMMPAPRSAYPRKTFLGFWQIAWPWIVGIAYTTPLPASPANWRLWAGNAVTGAHFVIDSYRLHRHPVMEFFPHFALNDGRVAWELSTDRPVRFDTFTAEQIAVIDLRTRHRTLLTAPDPTTVLGRIAMSGSQIVWESQRINTTGGKALPTELSMGNVRTGAVTQLSHNKASGQSSLYPRLQGRYLLFEQGPFGSDYGRPYLVNLDSRKGTGHPQWWRDYQFRRLGRTGLTNTQMGAGLVWWDDWRLLDVTRSRVWHLHSSSAGHRWSVDLVAGRTAIVARMNPATGHATYAAWRIPETCSAAGY